MKVAIIHYWLVNMRGGEKVLEALCELFPHADIYTHVYDPKKISSTIRKHNIYTTFISKLPKAVKWYQRYLPFMPRALESLDLSQYDLILSSESGPAKGVLSHSHTPHICYCHTPMRYLWDYYHHYLQTASPFTRLFFRWFAPSLRTWDVISANRVDYFIANSHNVAKRIQRIYRRPSNVIYPPVDLPHEDVLKTPKANFYLFFGQITSYKRADLAIEAFTKSGLPLIIAGSGDSLQNLPANITVLGYVDSDTRQELLSTARALIFPGEEDFGIIPLEAMAHGTPVIAYAKGGALETVKEKETGLLFKEPTSSSLQEAIDYCENHYDIFDKQKLYQHASRFGKERFQQEMSNFIESCLESHS